MAWTNAIRLDATDAKGDRVAGSEIVGHGVGGVKVKVGEAGVAEVE